MIYVSMIEIVSQARDILIQELTLKQGSWVTVLAFSGESF